MQRHVRQSKNFSCYFQFYSIRCCCSVLRYSRNTVGENKRKTKKEKQSPELFKQLLLLLRAMILEAPIVSEEIPSVLAQANSIRVVSCLPGWLLSSTSPCILDGIRLPQPARELSSVHLQKWETGKRNCGFERSASCARTDSQFSSPPLP